MDSSTLAGIGVAMGLCVCICVLLFVDPLSPIKLGQIEEKGRVERLGVYANKHYTEILGMLYKERRQGGVYVIRNQDSRKGSLERLEHPVIGQKVTFVSVYDDGMPAYVNEATGGFRNHRGIIARYPDFMKDYTPGG